MSCAKITALCALDLSTPAKLLGTIIASCGIRTPKELIAISGLSRTAVYRALEELWAIAGDIISSDSGGIPNCPINGIPGNPKVPDDGNCSEKTVPKVPKMGLSAPLAPRAPAQIEFPSGIDSSQVEILPPYPPKAIAKTAEGVREGETAAGHGVFVNCETIRHAAFTISIPAIEMGALAAGLTRDEIKTECLSHALQWAVEIEGGKPPRDVLPGKIKNFLCASVMGTKNRADVQSVRVKRADAGSSKALVPAESRVQRIMRLCEEAGERMGLNERMPS